MAAATKEFTPGEYAPFPTGIDSLRLEIFSLELENGDEALEEKVVRNMQDARLLLPQLA